MFLFNNCELGRSIYFKCAIIIYQIKRKKESTNSSSYLMKVFTVYGPYGLEWALILGLYNNIS